MKAEKSVFWALMIVLAFILTGCQEPPVRTQSKIETKSEEPLYSPPYTIMWDGRVPIGNNPEIGKHVSPEELSQKIDESDILAECDSAYGEGYRIYPEILYAIDFNQAAVSYLWGIVPVIKDSAMVAYIEVTSSDDGKIQELRLRDKGTKINEYGDDEYYGRLISEWLTDYKPGMKHLLVRVWKLLFLIGEDNAIANVSEFGTGYKCDAIDKENLYRNYYHKDIVISSEMFDDETVGIKCIFPADSGTSEPLFGNKPAGLRELL